MNKLSWKQRRHYAFLHYGFAILAILVFGLFWFVYGILHPEEYAPPTRSVCWLGLILIAVAWFADESRVDYRKHLYYYKHRSYEGAPKEGVFMRYVFLGMMALYVIVPTWGRYHVNNQGRYWAIEEDRGEGFYYQSDEDPNVNGEAYSSYPSWDFTCRARDPFSTSDEIYRKEGMYRYDEQAGFEWHNDLLWEIDTLIPGSKVVLKFSYRYWVYDDEKNLAILHDREPTEAELNSVVRLFVVPEVSKVIKTLPGDCQPGLEVPIDIGGFSPMRQAGFDFDIGAEFLSCNYQRVPIANIAGLR